MQTPRTAPLAFGLRILSEFPLEQLAQGEAGQAEVSFSVKRASCLPAVAAPPHNAYLAQGRPLRVWIEGTRIVAVLAGLLHFELELEAGAISCVAMPEATNAIIRYWFLQQILPIFVLFNGSLELLHATAVRVHGCAVAFLGSSGVGKSTLLHHFLERGAQLITDEHLALSRTSYTCAIPSIPFYRPYRCAEDLGIHTNHFSAAPVPLHRLYLLTPVGPTDPVKAEDLQASETVRSVLRNTQYGIHDPRTPQFMPLVASRFAGLARLARQVSVRRLHVPRAMGRLAEVHRFIYDDLGVQPAGGVQ